MRTVVDVRLALERTHDMPGRARAFVGEHLAAVPPDVRSDVVLLTSELVTNVVIHGATPAHLHLVADGHAVRVLVHDSGAGTPVTQPADVDGVRSTGRGLVIVAAVARSWGVDESDSSAGKDVWFDVELQLA